MPTPEQIAEAAERRRRDIADRDDMLPEYFRDSRLRLLDLAVLADAYLAEHPPDDDQPVDEEWLREMHLMYDSWVVGDDECITVKFKGRDWGITFWRSDLPTRRQVRLLLEALREKS